MYAPRVGGRTPRNFSPCGTTLDRGAPQLFSCPDRYFTYFEGVDTPIVEGLVIPFAVSGRALGTIWVVSHDEHRRFDAEDGRIMTALADFTAAALQTLSSGEAAAKTEEKLRQINEFVVKGLDHAPKHLRFVTWTLKYSRCHWLQVLGLEEDYARAELEARVSDDSVDVEEPKNITRFALLPPAGVPRP